MHDKKGVYERAREGERDMRERGRGRRNTGEGTGCEAEERGDER